MKRSNLIFFITSLVLVCFGFSQSLFAQKYDVGVFYGRSGYIGDLKDGPIPSFNYNAAGFYGKINFNPYIGIKGGLYLAKVGAADSLSSNFAQKQRNLSFETNITELNLNLEFNFFKFVPGNKYHNFTPFFYMGIAVFKFDPYTTYNKETVYLKPLSTEGQGLKDGIKNYSLFNLSIPIGGGIKWNFSGQNSIALEFSGRTSLTDYLDDVSGNYYNNATIEKRKGKIAAALADPSVELGYLPKANGKQRGNKTFTDFYLYTGITYIYTFKQSNCPQFK